MKKEVILAIVIGFGLGLIITYGIWLANKSLKTLPVIEPSPAPSQAAASPAPTPATTPTNSTPVPSGAISLTITSPADEILSDTPKITLKGTTKPNVVVAVTSEGAQQLVTADATGNFSAEITLDGGYNLITATAVDALGASASQTITVSYTTVKI